jgi:hypothetical protein
MMHFMHFPVGRRNPILKLSNLCVLRQKKNKCIFVQLTGLY